MRALLAFFLTLLPVLASAQGVATLVADTVFIAGGSSTLVAEGNVEVLYDDTRLTASRVTYKQDTDAMTIEGPIAIVTGDNDTIILANAAQIDPTLQNGLLRGARLVLDQQLQLAASQMNRVEGRYTQLYQVAATSCNVCQNKPPLWSIRASRVIHDEAERQLYFENAQFRIYDVPVLWVPRMRLPDPTLERATGLLIPKLRTTTGLGIGLKLPYFITLGKHRDLTLTPYFSRETRTLEARYRQAFVRGNIEINGAISRDSIRPDTNRGYIRANGVFALNRDFRLSFDVTAVSDDGYLLDYDYSDRDRIDSRIQVDRVRRDEFFEMALIHFESLRSGDNNAILPSVITQLNYDRRLFPRALGGELSLGINAQTLYRYSDTIGDDGRDVGRFGASADWQRQWTLNNGLQITAQGNLAVDHFEVSQDTNFPDRATHVTPSAALTLRYPVAKTTARGVRHVIEPTMQVVWSDSSNIDAPNEDSTIAKLDEANLFSLSRYPGLDRREHGLRGNIGLTYSRFAPSGWSSTLTLGRVIRDENENEFTSTSGLDGVNSDWLLAGQLNMPNGLALVSRSLLDSSFDFAKSETRLAWAASDLKLGASYTWLTADTAEDRPDAVSEFSLDFDYRANDIWSVSGDVRYDLTEDRPARAGIGIGYRIECAEVDFSVSRRYTSSTSVDPTTDFGLSVALRGFSAGRAAGGSSRSCKH